MTARFDGAIDILMDEMDKINKAKDGAYSERNQLVSALSKCFPAYRMPHPVTDENWEADWRWIITIQLPTGQACWHIHDSELPLFKHLDVRANDWDGHSTDDKYQRLAKLRTSFSLEEEVL